jgi:hypothetical protein
VGGYVRATRINKKSLIISRKDIHENEKIFAILLTVAITLSLAACGGNTETEESQKRRGEQLADIPKTPEEEIAGLWICTDDDDSCGGFEFCALRLNADGSFEGWRAVRSKLNNNPTPPDNSEGDFTIDGGTLTLMWEMPKFSGDDSFHEKRITFTHNGELLDLTDVSYYNADDEKVSYDEIYSDKEFYGDEVFYDDYYGEHLYKDVSVQLKRNDVGEMGERLTGDWKCASNECNCVPWFHNLGLKPDGTFFSLFYGGVNGFSGYYSIDGDTITLKKLSHGYDDFNISLQHNENNLLTLVNAPEHFFEKAYETDKSAEYNKNLRLFRPADVKRDTSNDSLPQESDILMYLTGEWLLEISNAIVPFTYVGLLYNGASEIHYTVERGDMTTYYNHHLNWFADGNELVNTTEEGVSAWYTIAHLDETHLVLEEEIDGNIIWHRFVRKVVITLDDVIRTAEDFTQFFREAEEVFGSAEGILADTVNIIEGSTRAYRWGQKAAQGHIDIEGAFMILSNLDALDRSLEERKQKQIEENLARRQHLIHTDGKPIIRHKDGKYKGQIIFCGDRECRCRKR